MNRNNANNTKANAPSHVIADVTTEGIEAQLATTPQSAGAMLRDARVAKKLSPEDVSKHLRISLKQIEAMETDNFAALPESVIVRGFMRNYARMLGVNPEPILEVYKRNRPEVTQSFTMHKSINMPIVTKDKQSWAKYVVASILIILGLGIWLFYVDLMGASTKLGLVASSLVPNTASTVSPVTESLPEIALPAAERAAQAEQNLQADSSNANANANLAPAANTSVSTPIVSSTSHEEPKVDLAAKTQVLDSGLPSTKINFSVKEETWINVTDANGQVIYNKILAAGRQDSLQIQALLPIKVIVGNISGTTFVFNGNPVDLASYAKLNVAKFSLK